MHLQQIEVKQRIVPCVRVDYFGPIITGMFKSLVVLLAIAMSISSTSLAKGPKGGQKKDFLKILEVSVFSISLSIGTDGSSHEEYAVNASTKVTLDGAPTNVRDLRSGMVAMVEVGSDGKTALSITAKDAPKHPGKHRVG